MRVKMAKNGKSQFAILGMIGLLKKCSGYDLKKHMEESTQYFWKETFSSIYPQLEELENKNLITKVVTRAINDRKRNVYALTPAGQKVLKEWLELPPETIQVRNELLLKLFFGTKVSLKTNIAHLETFKKELTSKLSTFRAIQQQLREADSLESTYGLITLDHGIRQASSALEWCGNAIKTLKSAKTKKLN
jgi:DNA-binding PadR family transcriptional regulator